MEDNKQDPLLGDSVLPPIQLTPRQEELCAKLDKFHAVSGLNSKPSEMFRGAVYALRKEVRTNPDLMAQAANSLRNIIYPFGKNIVPKKEDALKLYGSACAEEATIIKLGKLHGSFTEIAHNGNGINGDLRHVSVTPQELEGLLADFESVMFSVLTRQADIHSRIDQILSVDYLEDQANQ